MPRKKNKRKEIQRANQDAKPKPQRVGVIAHTPHGGSGAALAIAAAMAFPSMVAVNMLEDGKEGGQ